MKKKWTFYEDVICCYVYKEYFVTGKSTDLKDVIDKIEAMFQIQSSKKRNSIKQKLQNIKALMKLRGQNASFPVASRSNYSKQNKIAFDIVF